MQLSRLKKNVVAAVLAGSMVVALPGAALATEVTDSSFTVDKTWTAASNAQLNNGETFNFQVQFTGATQQGTWTPTDLSKDVKTVSLTADWQTLANGGDTATAKLAASELFAGYDFTAPGTYSFTVQEVAGANPNVVYDGTVYTVEVVVSMPDNYPESDTPVIREIKAKAAGGAKADAAAFSNTAQANDSLTVSKKVAGTAANTADEFTYTVTLEGVQGSYDFVKKTAAGQETTGTIASGDTFTLKHGESIEIKNLPEGAKYTVVETDTEYNEKNVADGVEGTLTATGTVQANGSKVAYTNEKGFAPATGINSDTLPFAVGGLVVAVAAGTLLISRKRRASEEF